MSQINRKSQPGIACRPLTLILRWAARISGAASLTLLLLFLFSHAMAGELKPDLSETLGLLLFPGGVILGLLLAFRSELAGAVTSLASLSAFYIWHVFHSGNVPDGISFLMFTSPAILFLGSGCLNRPNSCTDRKSLP